MILGAEGRQCFTASPAETTIGGERWCNNIVASQWSTMMSEEKCNAYKCLNNGALQKQY